MRQVEGTVTVPNYLTPQVELTSNLFRPRSATSSGTVLGDAPRRQLPPEVTGARFEPATGGDPFQPGGPTDHPLSVAGLALLDLGSPTGCPRSTRCSPPSTCPSCATSHADPTSEPSHPTLTATACWATRRGKRRQHRAARERQGSRRAPSTGGSRSRPAERGRRPRRSEHFAARRPLPAGVPQLPVPRPRAGAPRRARDDPAFRTPRPARCCAPRAVLRRQQPGRHHGRRADRAGPRLPRAPCSACRAWTTRRC